MAIVDEVSQQMKEALRAKQERRLAALRSIRAAFLNEMKRDGSDTLADDVCTGLLRRLEKQQKESIEAFEGAGREERAEAEREELVVIQSFLPSLADLETTRGWVKEAIASTGASTKGDIGRVMGALMKVHKGEVDGGLAKGIASDLLGQ
jgi:uncharacterized protein YqeY